MAEKSILITGGTGSFGKEYIKYLLENSPELKRIIIFSRDELKQWQMQQDFARHKRFCDLRFFLGDVRDPKRLEEAAEGVNFIIHAAALKQVHTAEYNPMEFIKTNILGAENVINAAIKNNVEKVVALSTDKAAAPVNLYGASKLCSDKLFLAANNIIGRKNITFSAVRYGNVMGSRGSVIPFFLDSVNKEEITITHKDMTRFNLTLGEGVRFVDFVLKNSIGGELYVPKLPSYKIMDVAYAIAPSLKYKFCGIRPGEKIHEEMITCADSINTLDCGNYFVVITNKRKLEDFQKIHKESKLVKENFNYSSGNNENFLTVDEIRDLIKDNIDISFTPL